MEYEELPDEMQEHYDNLKHTFLSIQCEIEDALCESTNYKEFGERVSNRMKEIHDESKAVANLFTTKKLDW